MNKYLTFFGFKDGISIYEILGDVFVNPSDTFIKIDTYIGAMSVAKINDTFDISLIPDQSINYFNIQIHDINTLRQYLREISDYGIVEDTLSKDRFSFYGPWKFNELTDYIYMDQKPYDNWIWNADTGNWTPPIQKPLLDHIFNVEWNQSRVNWDLEFIQQVERKYRGFQLWKMVPVTNSDFYAPACSSTEYMIKTFENLTHGSSNFDEILVNDHNIDYLKEKGLSVENPAATKYKIVKNHNIVIDFSPLVAVSYTIMEKEYIDLYSSDALVKMHPQCIGRTIQELFRLILEWAWCYRNLNSIEPMAIHCDMLLRHLQMPVQVRNDLLSSVPDQAVSKYLMGDSSALDIAEEDPECPDSFKYWIMDIYANYPKRNIGDELKFSIDNLPDYYPV